MTWIDWEKESALVTDVRAGLEAALDEIGADLQSQDFNEVSGYNEANIKTNKIVHRVIERRELPILHTWFRYGQYEPHDEFKPQYIHPRPLEQTNVKQPDEPSLPRRGYYSAEEYKGLFLSIGLEEILERDLYDFLEENYVEFAPDEFTQLYLENLKILDLLDDMMVDDSFIENSDFYYSEFQSISVDLQAELISNEKFELEIENHVEKSLDTLQDTLLVVSNREELSDDQRDIVRGIREFYHESVWRWPALIISKHEASGAGVSTFRDGCISELERVRNTYPEDTEDLRQDARRVGVEPSSEDYREVFDGISDSLVELERASMDVY
ncbi:hypothetical protein HZS55_04180 [Halosimplex rubrum]|uniref:DUF8098 domain-containing protein n=1 Tax=Halosimplex rubrum TaxID=869889 RepID=A0A7D5T448_9EURY|nr:hypothetical protein [Halosimplex rubrum]QLH76549.1 hypothetical protein HZS55_04180 [Halosimplex rubrum]